MRVFISKIESNLSYYLNQVKAGKKVIITSNKIPIAIIQSISKFNSLDLAKLFNIKNVSWNGKKPKGLRNPPKIKGKLASEMILRDRG